MKTLITTLVLALCTTIGFSQSNSSQSVSYGVRAGLTISNMDYKDGPINENQHRNGFLFGVYAEIPLAASLSVAPEIQFSPEGANHEDFANDYINVPVLLKYKLFDDAVAFGVGPQVGVKVHKDNDGFKNFVFSGVGIIEFKLTGDFYVDARYNYGFSNVFDEELVPEATTGVIQIGLNYKVF